MHLDPSQLNRAKKLFVLGNSTDMLFTALEGLGAELSVRWRAADHGGNLSQPMRQYVERIRVLSAAIVYASNRFTDILFRQQEIDWKKEVLAYIPKSDVFDQASDQKASSWRMFMGLAIKDFHVDISSLMDALAPIVIQVESKLKTKDVNSLPGWADIQKGTRRSYRKQLSNDICKIIDDTDRWWPSVKKVRDLLTHRKHDRIIFGNSDDGLLFQIYDQTMHPSIKLPSVLYRKEKYVVDFDLYSAFVLAELVVLLDEIGNAIASKLGISKNSLAQMCQREVVKSVAKSIERLIQATEESLSGIKP
jgi:hypothetical protein